MTLAQIGSRAVVLYVKQDLSHDGFSRAVILYYMPRPNLRLMRKLGTELYC